MVRHQTIAQQVDGQSCAFVNHCLREGVVIGRLMKNCLAAISSIQRVIPHTPNRGSGCTRHAEILTTQATAVNKRYVLLFRPEFNRETLEVLRPPLEEGEVTISRAPSSTTFPADSILVAAMNPCPCG
jgi:Magnesium chelatase, subunit ChlI